MSIQDFFKKNYFLLGYIGLVFLIFYIGKYEGISAILMYILLGIGCVYLIFKIYLYFIKKEGKRYYRNIEIIGLFLLSAIVVSLSRRRGYLGLDTSSLIYIGVAVVVIIIILILMYKNIQGKQNEEKIKTFVGSQTDLLSKLGWNQISFPIISFGGEWSEAISVKSLDEYFKQYFFKTGVFGELNMGLGSDKVIDANGHIYFTKKIAMKQIGYEEPFIKNLKLEQILPTGKIQNFETTKDEIISKILQNGKNSLYFGLVPEIKQTKNIDELSTIL